MTLEVLAAKVISVVLPYFAKGTEEFAKEAGKVAFSQVEKIILAIRRLCDKDPDTARRFGEFEKSPVDNRDSIQTAILTRLEHDRPVVDELMQLLAELGPSIRVIQRMKLGTNVVGLKARRMSRGSAEVKQHIDDANNVTGAEIDEI